MTESFVTARDGHLYAEASTGRVKIPGGRAPSYVREALPQKKGLSGRELWNALDAMSARLAQGKH